MLTWKRTFIAAAVVSNLVVFFGLGGVFLFEAMNPPPPSQQTNYTPGPGLVATVGCVFVAIGAVNLLCVYFAHAARTDDKRLAIAFGSLSCVLMAIGTVVIMNMVRDAFAPFVLGTVTFTTAGALLQVRPKPKPDWQCPKCEYDLRGLEGTTEGGENGVCPECGLNETERDAIADQ